MVFMNLITVLSGCNLAETYRFFFQMGVDEDEELEEDAANKNAIMDRH